MKWLWRLDKDASPWRVRAALEELTPMQRELALRVLGESGIEVAA